MLAGFLLFPKCCGARICAGCVCAHRTAHKYAINIGACSKLRAHFPYGSAPLSPSQCISQAVWSCGGLQFHRADGARDLQNCHHQVAGENDKINTQKLPILLVRILHAVCAGRSCRKYRIFQPGLGEIECCMRVSHAELTHTHTHTHTDVGSSGRNSHKFQAFLACSRHMPGVIK